MKILQDRSKLRSDEALLHLIQQGDEQALREAFRKYANVCFAAAITLLKDRALSTDVVVEVFKAVRANAIEIKDLRTFIFDKAKALTLAGLHELARKYFEEKELREGMHTSKPDDRPDSSDQMTLRDAL
jgi:DNA-directed RNA polymerase specialized sigma24 family protein